jgi:cell division protein FtsB
MKFIIVILFTILVLLQYRLWIGNGSLTEVNRLQQERKSITHENKLLRERNNSLAAEVLDLKQGLDAIEERARSEMGMIKKDETFYQIVDRKSLTRNITGQGE